MENKEITETASGKAALTPYQEATGLVRTYAAKLLGDDRAQEFATTLSILARQDVRFSECSKESVVTSMMACVQLNLIPNTPQQFASLIPYGNRLTFQLGYRGMIKLIQRSNQVKSISSELVFEGDKLKVKFGTSRQLVHEPDLEVDRTDYNKVTHAYATAVLANGEKVFEVMTRKEIDKVQSVSKAKSGDTPWVLWPESMAKKSVLKRFSKLLPSSSDDNNFALAAQLDSLAEAQKLAFQDGAFVAVEPQEDTKQAEMDRITKAMQRETVDLPEGTTAVVL